VNYETEAGAKTRWASYLAAKQTMNEGCPDALQSLHYSIIESLKCLDGILRGNHAIAGHLKEDVRSVRATDYLIQVLRARCRRKVAGSGGL
jgi:hypothetical protein